MGGSAPAVRRAAPRFSLKDNSKSAMLGGGPRWPLLRRCLPSVAPCIAPHASRFVFLSPASYLVVVSPFALRLSRALVAYFEPGVLVASDYARARCSQGE